MLTDEEEIQISNIISKHKLEILELITDLINRNDDILTKHCENMDCKNCKINIALNDLKSVCCWTTKDQFEIKCNKGVKK